jgi:AAA family ATP:ADP antiporter
MPRIDAPRADRPSAGAVSPVIAATIAAAAMIAQQVIGKATRDALFLSHFSAARLPVVITAGSIVSGAVVLLFARMVARFGPAVVVPRAFALHAVAMLLEWALALRFEPAVAVTLYLHTASLGATVVSAFWSVVSESFDPHTAKQVIGRIGGGAALGGLLGGVLAWGGSKVTTVPTMLLAGSALSLVCAWGVHGLARSAHAARRPPSDQAARASGLTVLRETPYLQLLALLVVLGALLQSLLDFSLGAQAKATYGTGARLLSFFALFQTAIGVVSFLLQTTANRPALARLGIGGTTALLPVCVAGFGAFAISLPSLATAALQRGAEGVLRASLFRSVYEVLFTPIPQSLKRPTKTVIDVSFDRVGGLVGSGLTLVLIALWPQGTPRAVTTASVIVAAAEIVIAYRLQRGYVATLGERLRSGALELDSASIIDATTRETLSRTFSSMDRLTLLAKIEAVRAAQAPPAMEPSPGVHPALLPPLSDANATPDELGRAMADLRSTDADTIRAVLRRDAARSPLLAPLLLEVLARDDVAREAMHVLGSIASRIVGTIHDAVLDEQRSAPMRRRAVRLLRGVSTQRAADGLVLALDTKAFDVRYASGRVLVGMREQNADLHFSAPAMFERAKRELEMPSPGARSLEHAFDILSLTFPREAIQLAYGALQSQDTFLRGVALEYLDVVLPGDVRTAMMPRLSRPPPAPALQRPSGKSLDDLLKSKQAILTHLTELRRSRDPDAEPSAS